MIVKTMHRGDDKVYELTVTNKQTGAVVDITGTTIKLTWKTSKSEAGYFLQKTANLTDPGNGVAEFAIDAADTASLTEKKTYYFDVEITKTTGKKETLLEGKFHVLMDVTT